MATSTNKTWRFADATARAWATASNWLNDDGSTSSAAPGTTAVVTFNGGNATGVANTVAGLIINGDTTFAGTSLTVTNDVTINGGSVNYNCTGALSVGRNFTNSGAFYQNNTSTGSLTFNGSQAAQVYLGSHSTRAITIAKTSNFSGSAITINDDIRCELTNTTASVFTFTSGYFIQIGTIYARIVVNNSTTARTWDQRADVYPTITGATTAYSGSQTTCTYVNRGYIRITQATAAQTLAFGAGAPSTCPNLSVDSNVNYVISGSLWEFYPSNGTHTSAATLTVFKLLGGSYSGSWTPVTIQLVSSSTIIGNSVDCAVRFGTITCPGSWTSGTTYTGGQQSVTFANVNCNTLNLNGVQASYTLNGGTVYTSIVFSTTSNSNGSTLNINAGTTPALTLSTNVNNTTNLNTSNSFTVTGTTTFNTGSLNLYSDLNTVSFTSTGTAVRVFDWKTGGKVVTSGAGSLSITLTSSCLVSGTMGGFYHGGTGTATGNAAYWDSVPRVKTWAASACTWTTWYTNDLEIVENCQIGTTSTINFTRNFTGSTSFNMAALTVNTFAADFFTSLSTVTYSGPAIAAFNHAVGSVTANINQLTAANITLSGASTTYNLGVKNTTAMSLNTTGTIALSGTSSTYNLTYVTGYNLTLSSTGTYNCYYYSHNYYTNPPTAGTVTHTAGTLVLKANTDNFSMTTWSFTSTTGTRGITFEAEGYITTTNTGFLGVDYASLTSVCPDTNNCGFYHGGTGSCSMGTTAPASPAAAFHLNWGTRCLFGTPIYVKNLNNSYPRGDGLRIGGGLIGNSSLLTINVSGNILFAGNGFSSGTVQNDSKWSLLTFNFWGADATRTSTYTTGTSYLGEGGEFRAFNSLTLAATYTGTFKLYQVLSVNTTTHEGGTLDVNGMQLKCTTSYNSTDGTVNKYITNTAATSSSPDILISATTGTPWSFAYSSLLVSTWKVWIKINGATIAHGNSGNSETNQPSFDLTTRTTAYTLSTTFKVGSLRISNYSPPASTYWYIGGPELTVYTNNLSAQGDFYIYTVDGGNSKSTTQVSFDSTSLETSYFTVRTNTNLTSNLNFSIIDCQNGTTTTCSGTSYLCRSYARGNSNSTLNIGNSTWVVYGSSALDNIYQGSGPFNFIGNASSRLLFAGNNGNSSSSQRATFRSPFGGTIENGLYYSGSGLSGTLTLSTVSPYSLAEGATQPLFNTYIYSWSSSKIIFSSPDSVLVKGSAFSLNDTSTKYIVGNLYNTESTGTVSANYLDITNSAASGGRGWYAGANSVDRGGNSGWLFYAPPSYTLSRSATTVDEGNSVTITLTTNVPNGTVIPYTISGTNITSADISGASLTGNFTISGGTASVTLNISADYATEGNETFTLALNNGAASIAVTIIDTTLTPTYSLSRSAASVTEGNSFTITLNTTNLPNGTLVPYTISGTGITSADIGGASLTGNFTIIGSTASLVINTTWDYVTEGTETLTVTITPAVGSSSAISVDIINLLHPTYALSTTSASVNEGAGFTITLNTTDVPNGTVIPYTISGTGITVNDFTPSSLTGSFTISANTASQTFNTTADYLTEGNETFRLTLDTIGTFIDVVIVDYYKTRTYALSTSATTVTEGNSFTITLTTTNVFDLSLIHI